MQNEKTTPRAADHRRTGACLTQHPLEEGPCAATQAKQRHSENRPRAHESRHRTESWTKTKPSPLFSFRLSLRLFERETLALRFRVFSSGVLPARYK